MIILPPDTPLNFEKIPEFRKRNSVPKIMYKWITGVHVLLWTTPVITASPCLLEHYRKFPKLYIDENTELTNQLLKKIDKLPQYTDDNVSSQITRWRLPLNLFSSASDKFREFFYAGLHIAQGNLNQ